MTHKIAKSSCYGFDFSSYDTSANPLIQELGCSKLDYQRKFHKAVMVHKSLHGVAPDYLCSVFTECSSIMSYSLRDTEGKLKNSFSYSCADCALE